MLLAQTAFHFVSEHYLIILLAFLLLSLAYRRQEIEGRIGLLLILLFALFFYYYYWKNLCRNQENIEPQTFIVYDEELSTEQLEYFESLHYKKIKECKTNKNLQLWSLEDSPSSDIIGSDGLADGGDGKVKGGSGEDNFINVSRNLEIKVPINNIPSNIILTDTLDPKTYPKNIGVDSLVGDDYVIALTDNGIDNRFYYPNLWKIPNGRRVQGLVGLSNGWNCVGPDNRANNLNINLPNSHGTLVTYLMERELSQTPHKILPFVILNENKEGFLFDALCAFEYAIAINNEVYDSTNRIRAINASWGFYGFENNALKHGIEKLNKNKILLVAAAGNSDENCDKCEKLEANNVRNLSLRKKKFYPASYSAEFENVISVTTLNINGDIYQASNQNYSNEFVDIGVQSDNYRSGDFLFTMPNYEVENYSYTDNNGNRSNIVDKKKYEKKFAFWGSSFATPIATAEIFSKKLSKQTSAQLDGTDDYVLDIKEILLAKDVESNGQEQQQQQEQQQTSNYRIESTWRATNLTKNGKVLLKKY